METPFGFSASWQGFTKRFVIMRLRRMRHSVTSQIAVIFSTAILTARAMHFHMLEFGYFTFSQRPKLSRTSSNCSHRPWRKLPAPRFCHDAIQSADPLTALPRVMRDHHDGPSLPVQLAQQAGTDPSLTASRFRRFIRRTIFGSLIKARAIQTRCCSPPESCEGT